MGIQALRRQDPAQRSDARADQRSFIPLPPVHLNIGARDFFLYDVRRMKEKLQRAGVDVTYIEQQDAKQPTRCGCIHPKRNGPSETRSTGYNAW